MLNNRMANIKLSDPLIHIDTRHKLQPNSTPYSPAQYTPAAKKEVGLPIPSIPIPIVDPVQLDDPDYLALTLNARVYDVSIESPLTFGNYFLNFDQLNHLL